MLLPLAARSGGPGCLVRFSSPVAGNTLISAPVSTRYCMFCCITDTWWTESKGRVLGSSHSKWYTYVHLLKPTAHETSASWIAQMFIQTTACVNFYHVLAWPLYFLVSQQQAFLPGERSFAVAWPLSFQASHQQAIPANLCKRNPLFCGIISLDFRKFPLS